MVSTALSLPPQKKNATILQNKFGVSFVDVFQPILSKSPVPRPAQMFFFWRPQWGEVLKPEAFSSSTPRQVEIMEALMNTVA